MVPPARIASLEQLDALVGRYVMDDRPTVYWEHTHSHWRFDNLEDALDALNDPFFAELVPETKRASLSVAEIREYPPYCADLLSTIKVVERLANDCRPLTISSCSTRWVAAFGADDQVEAPSASVAICIAALRARGIEVELTLGLEAAASAAA